MAKQDKRESLRTENTDSKRRISKSLQNTVGENPHIDYVHFDTEGNHHFNVHESENGELYARIEVKTKKDQNAREFKITTPILKSKIVESLSREQLLGMPAESDLTLIGINDLTPAEQKAIAKMRQGSVE
jgi:hypothetical protein